MFMSSALRVIPISSKFTASVHLAVSALSAQGHATADPRPRTLHVPTNRLDRRSCGILRSRNMSAQECSIYLYPLMLVARGRCIRCSNRRGMDCREANQAARRLQDKAHHCRALRISAARTRLAGNMITKCGGELKRKHHRKTLSNEGATFRLPIRSCYEFERPLKVTGRAWQLLRAESATVEHVNAAVGR